MKIFRVTIGGASYMMRLSAPTLDEVRDALVEVREEDVLEGETLTEANFIEVDEATQHRIEISDDEGRVSLYQYARRPENAAAKALTCTEWG